jgi:hypothetical protein
VRGRVVGSCGVQSVRWALNMLPRKRSKALFVQMPHLSGGGDLAPIGAGGRGGGGRGTGGERAGGGGRMTGVGGGRRRGGGTAGGCGDGRVGGEALAYGAKHGQNKELQHI